MNGVAGSVEPAGQASRAVSRATKETWFLVCFICAGAQAKCLRLDSQLSDEKGTCTTLFLTMETLMIYSFSPLALLFVRH